MPQSRLFQYAIIFQPTEKELENGTKSVLIQEIKTVLAVSDKQVTYQALKEIPEEYSEKLEQVQIVIRPF